MKSKSILLLTLSLIALIVASCKDSKSYTELLQDEDKAVNSFLAYQKVINAIPADTIFEIGENAPYYRIDNDGNVYMQVLKAGDRKNNRAKNGQTIYFRYGRKSLLRYEQGYDDNFSGNFGDMTSTSTSFKFWNEETSYATEFGYGIQIPLNFLGIDCEVNLVVRSQKGPYNEIASVVPYLYNIRYFEGRD